MMLGTFAHVVCGVKFLLPKNWNSLNSNGWYSQTLYNLFEEEQFLSKVDLLYWSSRLQLLGEPSKLLADVAPWKSQCLTNSRLYVYSNYLVCYFCVANTEMVYCFLRKEPSTNQVNKAVNQDALSKWFGVIPQTALDIIDRDVPMLRRLGYNTHQYPPDYSKLLDPKAERTMDLWVMNIFCSITLK